MHDSDNSTKYAVSGVIKKIKGATPLNLQKKFDWLKKVYWKEGVLCGLPDILFQR